MGLSHDDKKISITETDLNDFPKTLYSIVDEYKDLKDYKIIISKHSQELKALDDKDEYRFVINVYILKESKTLLACYTPTCMLPEKNADEKNRESIASKLSIMKKKFNNEVAQVDPELNGTAHVNGEKIQRKYDPEVKDLPPNTLKLGLSVEKNTYLGRSTANWKIFKLEPIIRAMFYFEFSGQKNFIINTYPLQYHLARSLPIWFMEKYLKEAHFKFFRSAANFTAYNLDIEIELEEDNDIEEKIIKTFLQRNIYIAAGMICSEATHIKYQVPPSHIIIKDILEQADKYHISLDLNWFPSLKDTFNINAPLGATAVMYAAKQGHLESMKILLKRGADYTRSDGEYENIFHYALKGRNRKILDELLLLPNIDELLFEKNTKNIAPVDIIQGRDPDLYKSIINDMLEKEEKNNSNDKKDNPNNLKPLNEFFTYMHQELTNTIQDTKSNTLFETKQLKIFLKQFDELLTASQKNLQLQVDVSQIKTLLDARKGFLEIAHRGKNPTGIYATTYSSALLLIKKLLEEITPYVELIKHQKTP